MIRQPRLRVPRRRSAEAGCGSEADQAGSEASGDGRHEVRGREESRADGKGQGSLAKASHGAVKAKVALTKAAEDAVKAIKASRNEATRFTGLGGGEETADDASHKHKRMKPEEYEKALAGLQVEMVKLQEWIKFKKLKVVVVFEGRDAAGKGGCIKRITESLSPRVTKVVALPAPTEREQGQWYFQRYVQHLPAAGEMVLMDRRLVQPRRGREGDGFLHTWRAQRVPAQPP